MEFVFRARKNDRENELFPKSDNWKCDQSSENRFHSFMSKKSNKFETKYPD